MEKLGHSWWLPPDLSTHGAGIDQLITILHYFMITLFVGWGIFLIYCLIKFRARPGHKAVAVEKHFRLPTYLEIGVAVIELGLLLFISYPVWSKVKHDFPKKEDSVEIRVVAEQFAWNIHYPGKDGIFGRTSIEFLDPADNPLGLDREGDPNAKDDYVSINALHIPVNKPVIAHLSSKDVIHSFFLPVLRVKQDTIPGMEIPVWFEATQTGQFDIACAQLCGVGHTTMKGRLMIESPEEFSAWQEQQHAEMMEYYGGGGQ